MKGGSDMYDLRNLREMLCKELDEIAEKREMSAGDLDAIQKLTSSIKNTYKIEMAEDGGYSRDGEWEADMRGTYGRAALTVAAAVTQWAAIPALMPASICARSWTI